MNVIITICVVFANGDRFGQNGFPGVTSAFDHVIDHFFVVHLSRISHLQKINLIKCYKLKFRVFFNQAVALENAVGETHSWAK